MSRFFVRPDSPEGWAAGLASPSHWREGYSAYALAYTWHPSGGVPAKVSGLLSRSGIPSLRDVELIAGIPEYKVALPGGNTASQTDLFALLRGSDGATIAMAVEGKAEEAFGDNTVAGWRKDASDGKKLRLRHLLSVLGLRDDERLGPVRYQLLHRTASAVIEAERLNADLAVMLVHSFSPTRRWFAELQRFLALYEVSLEGDGIVRLGEYRGRPLYVGWLSDVHPEAAA